MTDLKALENFLDHNVIPKIKKRPKTFLGIAKQPHYENVMSNIYAFYFNVDEVHGMGDLFITSLLQLIDRSDLGKQKLVRDITNFEVSTEVTTSKNGRIDLLLSSPDHAIIIENKVYHHLNNNLIDYWESTKVTAEESTNKIGIVLSLNKVKPAHPHFINITHVELLKHVMQNAGQYLMSARDKYIVYLKDFYQNSLNLSKSEMDSKEIKFYFDNQAKIIEAKDFHFAMRTHIANQVEQLVGMIDEELVLPISRGESNKRLRYLLSQKNKNLMFTIVFEKVLTPQRQLILILELKNELLENKELYKAIDFDANERLSICDSFYTDLNTSWCHFAVRSYTLKDDEVANLSEFIVNKLQDDGLLSIFRKLHAIIPKLP